MTSPQPSVVPERNIPEIQYFIVTWFLILHTTLIDPDEHQRPNPADLQDPCLSVTEQNPRLSVTAVAWS